MIDDVDGLKHLFLEKVDEMEQSVFLGASFGELQNILKKNSSKKEIKNFLINKAFTDGIFNNNLVEFGKYLIITGYQNEGNESLTFDRLLNK